MLHNKDLQKLICLFKWQILISNKSNLLKDCTFGGRQLVTNSQNPRSVCVYLFQFKMNVPELTYVSRVGRMELKPFNIDVIVLVPGSVLSSIGKRACEVCSSYLSSLNLFKPFEPFLLKRAMLSQGPNATTATEFAEKAVRVLIGKSPPAYFTYGYLSSTYLLLSYCPAWVRDWWFSSSVPSEVLIKKDL